MLKDRVCVHGLLCIYTYTHMWITKWTTSLNVYVNKCQCTLGRCPGIFWSMPSTHVRLSSVAVVVCFHCCVTWQPNTALFPWVATGFVATVTLPVSSIPKNHKETNPRRQESSSDCFLKCFSILSVLTFSKTQLSITKWKQQVRVATAFDRTVLRGLRARVCQALRWY